MVRISVALVSGLLMAAGPSFAQNSQPMPMAQTMMEMMGDICPMKNSGMMGQGMKNTGMMTGSADMMPMIEGRLAYLKVEIVITEAQSKVWAAYADAMKAQHSGMQAMHASMQSAMQSRTLMERLAARADAMQVMADNLKALVPTTTALYAALNTEQKSKADVLLDRNCGMM